jgi:hypothetical protein
MVYNQKQASTLKYANEEEFSLLLNFIQDFEKKN